MRFSPRFDRWRSGTLAALARFPWNLVCGLTGALAMIASLHASEDHDFVGQCARLAMTAAIGMPLFFSLRMLRERFDRIRRWPIELVGLPLLAAWFFAQPARPTDAPAIVLIRWLLLLAALHFFAAVSSYVRNTEGPGFWQFNRRLFLRFCLATLYTGVLTAGLELALLSADKLFQLKIDKIYAGLFFVMIGIFHPAFFLAGVPRDFAALEVEAEYPRGLKAFTQFALAPLVAVYALILYAYALKIVLAWSWPRGWVALPVLLLSGIGIFAFLLLYPLRARPEEKWAVWFTKTFPRALAPLTILLLLSVRVRIIEYGVTEQRYLGVVAGGWILLWSLSFIVRKSAGIRWIPSSLAIICALSAFGPWSAGAISKASQVRRITHILQAQGLWKDNHAAAAPDAITLAKDDQTDLRTTLTYLIGTHGGETIQKIFEPLPGQFDWKKLNSWTGVREIIAALNISNRDQWDAIVLSRIKSASIDIQGFQRIWHLGLYNFGQPNDSDCPPSHHEDVKIWLEHGLLRVATDQESSPRAVPFEFLIDNIDTNRGSDLPDKDLTVDFNHGARVFRIIFDTLNVYREQQGKRLSSCEVYLLEK